MKKGKKKRKNELMSHILQLKRCRAAPAPSYAQALVCTPPLLLMAFCAGNIQRGVEEQGVPCVTPPVQAVLGKIQSPAQDRGLDPLWGVSGSPPCHPTAQCPLPTPQTPMGVPRLGVNRVRPGRC